MYLGIDIGTTNCKLGLVDKDGRELEPMTFKTPVIHPRKGWAEYDCNTLWDLISDSVKKITSYYNCQDTLNGIAISSQGESGLFVDENGIPLMNAIAWYDDRTKSMIDNLESKIDSDEIREITGIETNYIHSLFKMQWIKVNSPSIYKQAHKWHCLSDFLVRKMTGKIIMDYSLASRTMLFDIRNKEWSSKLLDVAELDIKLLPKPVPSGEIIDSVKSSVKKEWGIKGNVSVVSGGFDHMVGCYGLGANFENQAVISIGTTESLCLYSNSYKDAYYPGFSQGRHVFNDSYYILGGMPSGGETIEWAIKTILNYENVGTVGFDSLKEAIRGSDIGSNGVIFLPHLKGCVTPNVDSTSRGMFVGLSIQTTSNDLIRSITEGLCFEFRLIIDQFEGGNLESFLAIGGGVKNQEWMQIKADVLNKKVITLEINDAVIFGAAKLVADALNEPIQLDENVKRKVYYPENESVIKYEEIYRKTYTRLYELNREILRRK
ncbi:FGGY family carbohydrate kinase [Aquibacillus halophilus]|uniref:FGGY family carbohydrate kinase n=1 Tax=Aquibacillus halophilus TaxID=930132 RepID=UPI00147945DE